MTSNRPTADSLRKHLQDGEGSDRPGPYNRKPRSFADATRIWNGLIRKTPAVVVQPTVGFARENRIELSIKGRSQHRRACIVRWRDHHRLLRMRQVEVDPVAMTVKVQPGCNLGEVDRATQQHGWATTLGFVSETGVAGLTLGGGFGYLTRQFGWTVDDLLEVELVTAGGDVVRASRDRNHGSHGSS